MIKEINLVERILESNFRRLNFPYKSTHAITYKCNSRCMTCNIWAKKHANELTLEELDTFYAKSNKFSWISITGGEIFLRKDIVDIVESVVRNCKNLHTLTLPTNGLLTDKIVKCVQDMVLKTGQKLIITVSLDGPEDLHDVIRGVKGGWRRTVDTFNELRKIPNVEAYFGMTISSQNVGRVKETVDSLKQILHWITPKDFHVNLVHASSHYYANVENIESYPIEKAIEEIKAFRKMKGYRISPIFFLEQEYLKRIEKYLHSGESPLPCKAASASCFIDPTGQVYPCSIWDKPLGRLRDVNYELSRLWNSKSFKETAILANERECPNCWTPCEAYQTILGNILTRSS